MVAEGLEHQASQVRVRTITLPEDHHITGGKMERQMGGQIEGM